MDIAQEQIMILKENIIKTVVHAIDNDQLDEAEWPKIAYYVLENTEKITTQDQLLSFLKYMSLRWPIFLQLRTIAYSEKKEHNEKIATENVLHLVRDGKLDEALQLARSAQA